MNPIIWVTFTQLVWTTAVQGQYNPGNYYHNDITTIKPPKILPKDAYFGFSVAYYSYTKGLIISAPRTTNFGEIYECMSSNSWQCSELHHDMQREVPKYKHDYWFGATVRTGKDFLVSCAPRYTAKSENFAKDVYGTYSRCYSRNKNKTLLAMTLPSNKEVIHDTVNGKIENYMDSLGWSMDIDTKSTHILIGGPAMYTGRALEYVNIYKQPHLIYPTDGAKYNFGYAVAIGNFFKFSKTSYAIGSPYGKIGTGMVQLYKLDSEGYLIERQPSLETQVVGSMFGSVLCTVTLTADRADLLVGAPAYADSSLNSHNMGAVYVYTRNSRKNTLVYQKVLKGKKDGIYFGFAIASMGDINGDQIDEIAIAAPYEDNGVVYLYSGIDLLNKKTSTPVELQRITSDIHRPFGLSIAALIDYDDNGCNELAVGAPLNDTVVLLKCSSPITVKALKADLSDLMARSKGVGKPFYMMKVCFDVKYPKKPTTIFAVIQTTVSLRHSDAVLNTKGSNKTVTFTTNLNKKEPRYCQNVEVIVPEHGNYDLPVMYKISSELVDHPLSRKTFDPSRVTLSDTSLLQVQDSVSIANCAHGLCIPKLDVTMDDTMGKTYTIGTNSKEDFSLTVTNTGEMAYDPCVMVVVHDVHMAQLPIVCQPNANAMQCKPKKPIGTGETWTIDNFSLEMVHLSSQLQKLKIEVWLFDHCKDVEQNTTYTDTPPQLTTEIALKTDPKGVEIKGECSIKYAINMTSSEMNSDETKAYEHIYTIINDETVIWENMQCQVDVLNRPYLDYSQFNISIAGASSLPKCVESERTEDYIRHKCTIEKIEKRVSIMLPFSVIPSKLNDYIDDNKTLQFDSNFTLFFDETSKMESVVTTLSLVDASVPVWAIVVACLLGLLFLVLIILILRKCGCLRRQHKKELENLRKSIRRQTMRQSMAGAAGPCASNDDRTQILQEIDESAES